MSYKLQREFAYGWDDTEFGDNEEVVTYNSLAEANEALNEYILDINEAHQLGFMEDPYEGDVKVVEI